MQIVIDIPDEYRDLFERERLKSPYALRKAFEQSIPLPKGHGRLIDADRLITELKKRHDFFVNAYGGYSKMQIKDSARVDEIETDIGVIFNAPTIIEANNKESEG